MVILYVNPFQFVEENLIEIFMMKKKKDNIVPITSMTSHLFAASSLSVQNMSTSSNRKRYIRNLKAKFTRMLIECVFLLSSVNKKLFLLSIPVQFELG